MPYIKEEARERVARHGDANNAGELNYLFTLFAHAYLINNGQTYQAFNDILGALEGAKLELYRRKIAPYEDIKMKENGDVD